VVAVKRLIAAFSAASIMILGAKSSPQHGAVQTRKASGIPAAAQRHAAHALGKLPLAFEPNVGQTDPAVQFLAHGSGSAVFLTSTGATLSFGTPDPSRGQRNHLGPDPSSAPAGVVALSLTFVGADQAVHAVGIDRLPGVSNYFLGNDPSVWRTRVPQYAKVTYRNLYPGIDLSFYGNEEGQLEYDLSLRPGEDPSIIRLAFRGSDSMTLDRQGDLVLRLGGREVIQPRPKIYQEAWGSTHLVPGRYVLQGSHVGFAVGRFDRGRPLIIDPEVEYSTFLGGSGDELGDVQPAVDGKGHLYICGNTDSTDFPVTPGVIQPTEAGDFDAFVSEVNSDGSGLVYSTFLGGSSADLGIACALDSSGDLHLTGVTGSEDFPITQGVVQPHFAGGDGSICFGSPCDGYVAKLSPDGARLIYSTYVGGSGDESLGGIQVDQWGDAVVAGSTSSTDFPATPGAFQTKNAGGVDAVVAKLNATASSFVYSTYLGGKGDDGAGEPGLAVDSNGNAYVEGVTNSTRFPTTPRSFQRRYAGNGDFFVTKLDPTGSRLVHSTYLGGSGPEVALNGTTVDASGNAYIVGTSCSTDFPVTPGAFQTKDAGDGPSCFGSITDDLADGTVTELNSTGSALVFSTYLGGKGLEELGGGQTDASGHVFVGGVSSSIDYPVTPDAFQRTNHGGPDRFDGTITELASDGSRLIFSTYWGGTGDDLTEAGALDGSGNLYVTGCTASSDFPTTKGALQRTFAGGDGTGFGPCAGGMDAIGMKAEFKDGDGRAKSVHRGT
jgi:Beta-propeller repeat